ncbi:MAG: mannitol dehydrogenase family protein [Treponema sp.]|jgi:mannitol-1-phosphate/altronate dehydrogenase|nr:mannitol dehydrogenase family protein [Treponema sp.]
MNAVNVNEKNLEALGALSVPGVLGGCPGIPRYDRRALRRRLVHLGLGHFHRAHQAVYVDELLNRGLTDTGIFEMNLVPDTYALGEIAAGQDYLYTLLARGAGGEEDIRVVGSIVGYLNAVSHPTEALEILSHAETAVISLTVTEKGYCYDTAKGDLAWDHEDLIHDVRRQEAPRTMIGFLAAALDRRRLAGTGPVTVMSCDNFPSNGKVLSRCIGSFCRETRPELVPWLEDNVSFPLSMVDRITPGTTGAFLEDLAGRYGIADRWAVGCEDFRQWVLETNFQKGFPLNRLEEAGVLMAEDVEPYERMKIRLLNGSHSALAYPAWLLGYAAVTEAMEDPALRCFIRDFYMEEIGATVPHVPGLDPEEYKDTLIRRFSNRHIADTIPRLASDGSRKIPNAILEPLAELVRAGSRNYGAILLALAFWARFLTGTGEHGEDLPLDDPAAADLSTAARLARNNPAAFLRAVNTPDLPGAETLAADFALKLEQVYTLGVRGALLAACPTAP